MCCTLPLPQSGEPVGKQRDDPLQLGIALFEVETLLARERERLLARALDLFGQLGQRGLGAHQGERFIETRPDATCAEILEIEHQRLDAADQRGRRVLKDETALARLFQLARQLTGSANLP